MTVTFSSLLVRSILILEPVHIGPLEPVHWLTERGAGRTAYARGGSGTGSGNATIMGGGKGERRNYPLNNSRLSGSCPFL